MRNAIAYDVIFNVTEIATSIFREILSVGAYEKIARRGLKKSFVLREENLNCKIKGRLLVSKNIEKNLCMQRQERMYCSYQEWTCDTAENRLLKKALHFSRRMLRTMNAEIHPKLKEVERTIAKIFPLFEQVSEEIKCLIICPEPLSYDMDEEDDEKEEETNFLLMSPCYARQHKFYRSEDSINCAFRSRKRKAGKTCIRLKNQLLIME